MTQKKTTAQLRESRQRKPKVNTLGVVSAIDPRTGTPFMKEEHLANIPKYMGDKGVEAFGSMPIQFGRIKARIFGGPFREYVPGQRRVVSVKMAAEIDKACDISIPTKDYDVPPMNVMHSGVAKALQAILDGNDLYAGCWGGTGRTGLFMACMAKVMLDYQGNEGEWKDGEIGKYKTLSAPVAYVRKHYRAHAVETQEQEKFVAEFDTSGHVFWLAQQLRADTDVEVRSDSTGVAVFVNGNIFRKVAPVEKIVEKEVRVEVPVYYWNPLRAFLNFWLPERTPRPGDQMPPY